LRELVPDRCEAGYQLSAVPGAEEMIRTGIHQNQARARVDEKGVDPTDRLRRLSAAHHAEYHTAEEHPGGPENAG
jgi:hypothetical protein